MAQLLVRKLPSAVVMRLKARARADGISVEEAHRRLLRDALCAGGPAQPNFVQFLTSIPKGGNVRFTRSKELPRRSGL